MKREQKARVVEELKSNLGDSNATFFVGYKGVDVCQMQILRRRLRENGAKIKVAKVNLVSRAVEGLSASNLNGLSFEGQLGVVFVAGDAIAAAKVLVDFSKEHGVLDIRSGFFESKVIGADAIQALAALPSKQQLVAMLAGALNQTIAGLARALNGVAKKLAEEGLGVADK